MFLSDLNAKLFCLKALLWSELVASSLCDDDVLPEQVKTDLLLLATPSIPTTTSTAISTITVTKTIDYKPSLIPGNAGYTLLGCYGRLNEDGGQVFGGDEYDLPLDEVASGNVTIESCASACHSTASLDKTGLYTYVGLQNGDKCICGRRLSSDARKLPADDCITPCSGDPRLACGGHDNVAVYGLSNSKSEQPTAGSDGTASRLADSNTAPNPATGSDTTTENAVSVPTIAAITASLSGAIIVATGLFLWCRARKRKTQVQETHVKLAQRRQRRQQQQQQQQQRRRRHGRRSAPGPILTGSATTLTAVAERGRGGDADSGSGSGSGGSGTDDGDGQRRGLPIGDSDFIPTTPALETGARAPAGLHVRTAAAPERRDGAYGAQAQAAAASSAVQWRPGAPSTLLASARGRAMSSSSSSTAAAGGGGSGGGSGGGGISVQPPPLSARVDGLGERAWHRRKLSAPYRPTPPPPPQPPPSTGIGIAIGHPVEPAAIEQEDRRVFRGNRAQRGPPSGPPGSLPPGPPPPRRPARSPAAMSPKLRDAPWDDTTTVSDGWEYTSLDEDHLPVRPRRSFDTLVLEPGPGSEDSNNSNNNGVGLAMTSTSTSTTRTGLGARFGPGTGAGAGPATGGAGGSSSGGSNALGMSHPNVSTPSLGRYGSLSKTAGRIARVESPVLGWRAHEAQGRRPWGATPPPPPPLSSRRENDAPPARRPGVPVLPPIAPGERFDHRRWRGTIYAQPYEARAGEGRMNGSHNSTRVMRHRPFRHRL